MKMGQEGQHCWWRKQQVNKPESKESLLLGEWEIAQDGKIAGAHGKPEGEEDRLGLDHVEKGFA